MSKEAVQLLGQTKTYIIQVDLYRVIGNEMYPIYFDFSTI